MKPHETKLARPNKPLVSGAGSGKPEKVKAWGEFARYLADIRTLSSLFGKALFIAPIMGSMVITIGPPWPMLSAVSVLTMLSEVLVSMFVFQRAATRRLSSRLLNRTLSVSVFCLLSYLLLYAFFVREMPDSKHRDVQGFIYTPAARSVINDTYSESDALRGAGYRPTELWVGWTVFVIRYGVLCTWFLFFCFLSAYLAQFTIVHRYNRGP